MSKKKNEVDIFNEENIEFQKIEDNHEKIETNILYDYENQNEIEKSRDEEIEDILFSETDYEGDGLIQNDAVKDTKFYQTEPKLVTETSAEDKTFSKTEIEKEKAKVSANTASKYLDEEIQSGETKKNNLDNYIMASKKSILAGSSKLKLNNKKNNISIMPIDAQRSVETESDKVNNDILDIVESLKSGKILTGNIQGVEHSPDNPNLSFAVIYHGAIKVIIPAEEAVSPPNDFRGQNPADVLHYLMTKRLGAEVDYVIKGVDSQTGIAAASRLQAMASKRKHYYWGTDRNGNNLLYSGVCAECRVVSVIRAGIFVDIFGLEVYIPLRELSYQRWIDASSHYAPGDRVIVKLISLERLNKDNINVTASVKQAGENPYDRALRRYTVGNRYIGSVSMVDVNGVFVSLDGGIDCLCQHPKRGRPPRGSRVTVRILGINEESNRIWGVITHITTLK